jgi:hypothetical protein
MKSLSILILLGTLTALVVGGIFAVSPVLAEKIDTQEISSSVVEPVAPLTGQVVVDEPVLAEAQIDPAVSMAAAFTLDLEKDTAGALVAQQAVAENLASFETFVASVINGSTDQVTGIYVQDVLAYSVIRQPNSNAAYVSDDPSQVTQFGMAADYGSIGFLAHNYLAGATFFELTSGQIVTLVYGDGSTADFEIESIRAFQALSPNSTQSDFVDLDTDKHLSVSNLFHQMYNGDNAVVLQTCIAHEGISTWGRLFVIAVPLS